MRSTADAKGKHVTVQRTAASVLAWLALLLASAFTVGCGNALYVMNIDDAESQLEQAEALEAERYATYEFHAASSRLDEAKRQAAQAEYGYAMQLADEAADFARKARDKAQKARAKEQAKPGSTSDASSGVGTPSAGTPAAAASSEGKPADAKPAGGTTSPARGQP
ncbi:MAG TPA: DUF4398 domain-containing protein [Polyangiaceae bacterium]|nr:DUF4398 domain-containing protein [Polyangiaceae bacterium]